MVVKHPDQILTEIKAINQKLREIGFVRDRSGSMSAMKDEAIGGINAFLESQKELSGEARFTIVLFDHEYIVAHDGVPIQDVPHSIITAISPRDYGAADAIGLTINAIGERLNKTPEAERPGKVIIAILTDGLENASQEFNRKEIFKMIKHHRKVQSWEFVFLAAKQDAISTGARMGIAIANAVTFSEAPGGAALAFDAVSCIAASYRAGDADYVQHLAKAAKKDEA